MEGSKYLIATCLLTVCGFGTSAQNDQRPNIVLILADDLGYSDLGCYGGEINTPNIDKLAKLGVRFTQFYNCARSCPSRASLLTGKHPHQVGIKTMGSTLSPNAATIAEVLRLNGYHTGMVGKWHLAETKAMKNMKDQLLWLSHRKDSTGFAPLNSYPYNRGFEVHWGTIWGVVNYFDPFSLVHNEEVINEVPPNFYITDFITDKSIDLIDQFSKDEKPFFLYIAHNAPHWPLQALPEDIKKYKGVYDEGWDVLRKKRYDRLIQLGIIDAATSKLGPNKSGKVWADCENKEWEARHMETHAAMVDRLDQSVGKVVEKLRQTGKLENTLIFILSDNGASPERGFQPGFDRPGQTRNGDEIDYKNFDRPGAENTWGYLGAAWAGAINSPFIYWKKESYEGGTCTPFIVYWPKGLKVKGNSLNKGMAHVMDILPTCMEFSGVSYLETVNGVKTSPIEGKSLLPLLQKKIKTTHDTLFWEHEGGRAVRLGDWKMSALNGKPWELFDLSKDRTETNNLSTQYPDKVKQLDGIWDSWYKRVNQ